MDRRCHLPTSGAVFVRSCVSVFAVMTTFVSSQVESAQFTSMPMPADLPIPWPDALATISGWWRVAGFCRWSRISASISACQSRGPS